MKKKHFVSLSITYIILISYSLGIILSNERQVLLNTIIAPFITLIGAIFLYRNRNSLDDVIIPDDIQAIATTYMQLESIPKTAKILHIHKETVRRGIIKYIKLTSKYLI